MPTTNYLIYNDVYLVTYFEALQVHSLTLNSNLRRISYRFRDINV